MRYIIMALLLLNCTVTDASEKYTQWALENGLPPNGYQGMLHQNSESIFFYGEINGDETAPSKPQKIVSATHAAVMVAHSEVAKYLNGFNLKMTDGFTNAKYANLVINTTSKMFLKRVQTVYSDYDEESDIACAVVKINIQDYRKELFGHLNDPEFKSALTSKSPAYKADPPLASNSSAYDGVIIDATGLIFRPALVNRIIAPNGNIVYDPLKIDLNVLVKNGCGEYTNKVNKAVEILKDRGALNPMVIKAIRSPNKVDVEISENDAIALYSANEQSKIFNRSMVAFVMN